MQNFDTIKELNQFIPLYLSGEGNITNSSSVKRDRTTSHNYNSQYPLGQVSTVHLTGTKPIQYMEMSIISHRSNQPRFTTIPPEQVSNAPGFLDPNPRPPLSSAGLSEWRTIIGTMYSWSGLSSW